MQFSNPGGEEEEKSRKSDGKSRSDRKSEHRSRERIDERPTREGRRSAREKDKEVVKQLAEIKAAKKAAKNKPSREERGYTKPRGRKDDWMQFFMQDSNLKGEAPNFNEDGWAKKNKKK